MGHKVLFISSSRLIVLLWFSCFTGLSSVMRHIAQCVEKSEYKSWWNALHLKQIQECHGELIGILLYGKNASVSLFSLERRYRKAIIVKQLSLSSSRLSHCDLWTFQESFKTSSCKHFQLFSSQRSSTNTTRWELIQPKMPGFNPCRSNINIFCIG